MRPSSKLLPDSPMHCLAFGMLDEDRLDIDGLDRCSLKSVGNIPGCCLWAAEAEALTWSSTGCWEQHCFKCAVLALGYSQHCAHIGGRAYAMVVLHICVACCTACTKAAGEVPDCHFCHLTLPAECHTCCCCKTFQASKVGIALLDSVPSCAVLPHQPYLDSQPSRQL